MLIMIHRHSVCCTKSPSDRISVMASGARASKRQKKPSARGARASELQKTPSAGGARASELQKKPARGARVSVVQKKPSARSRGPQLIAPKPTMPSESGAEFNTGDVATVCTESRRLLQRDRRGTMWKFVGVNMEGERVRGNWQRVVPDED